MAAGVSSFFSHAVAGVMGSISGLSGTVARNLHTMTSVEEDTLSRDLRVYASATHSFGTGLQSGARSLSTSIVAAVAGMFTTPYYQVRRDKSMWAFVKGFGKGMFGVVAKPIGGALTLIAQTAQGLSHTMAVDTADNLSRVLNVTQLLPPALDITSRIRAQSWAVAGSYQSHVPARWMLPSGGQLTVQLVATRAGLLLLLPVAHTTTTLCGAADRADNGIFDPKAARDELALARQWLLAEGLSGGGPAVAALGVVLPWPRARCRLSTEHDLDVEMDEARLRFRLHGALQPMSPFEEESSIARRAFLRAIGVVLK